MRAGALAAAAACLGVAGYGWHTVGIIDRGVNAVEALTGDEGVRDADQQLGDMNYLIVGADSRAGANAELGAGNEADIEGTRSDTVMLVNIPADRSRVVAVSFPRDLDIYRPACARWDNSSATYDENDIVPAEYNVKLNSAYAWGGPKCLTQVVRSLSGLSITHFVGIDFIGFEKMVDTLGGVDVCTTTPLIDGELGTILETPGTHKIDGKQALNYVRARYIPQEGTGDYGRIKRQQLFLSSLLRSALSGNILLDPSRLNGFIRAFTEASFGENLTTKSLAQLGQSLQGIEAGRITFLTVPTSETNEFGNEVPRTADINNIFNAIITDHPLPGEAPLHQAAAGEPTTAAAAPGESADPAAGSDVSELDSPAGQSSPSATANDNDQLRHDDAVDVSLLSISVRNATNTSGLAEATSTKLADQAVPVVLFDTAPDQQERTMVLYAEGHEAQAASLAAMIPGAVIAKDPRMAESLEVILGENFNGEIISPPAVGTALTTEQASPEEKKIEPLPADLTITNAGSDICG